MGSHTSDISPDFFPEESKEKEIQVTEFHDEMHSSAGEH